MKLILCKKCSDIVKLTRETKFCECGNSYGQYSPDGINATYGGDCLPLGISNPSFVKAIRNQPKEGWGEEFKAFVIPEKCDTFKKED